MTINRRERAGLTLYTFPALEAVGARHAVATRLGGVSQGAFSTLNLGYSVGDDPAHVQANRRALYASIDTEPETVVTCHQIHSATVTLVSAADAGRGAIAPANTIPQTDALITDRPDLYLFLRFADCVPILFCDPEHGAVGLTHAGWKGTINNIVANTVSAMSQAFASHPRDLLAAIGPAIGPCHYIIQEDVARQVRRTLPFWRDVLQCKSDGELAFDLPEANRHLLLDAGLAAKNIIVSGLCTACHVHEFYSHRAERGKTGRFGVLIGWRGDDRP